jgi:hypothetical protein
MADIATTTQIQGRRSIGNIAEEMGRKVRSEANRVYDSANAITVPNGSADVDLISLVGASTLFTRVPYAAICEIYTNANISIKIATEAAPTALPATLDPINIRANTLRTLTQVADIVKIYVSNSSGGAATVEVLLT